jgi:hypothetical protein
MCSSFKQYHSFPSSGYFWKLRLAEILLEGLLIYYAGIKVCGISKFSRSVLRSGVQHSCGRTAQQKANSDSWAINDNSSARKEHNCCHIKMDLKETS